MDLGIANRVALVTGASAGIGRAIASKLAAEGCRVAIASRSRERIAAAAADIGATGFVFDARDDHTVPALVDKVSAALGGPPEIVVANTGGPPAHADPLALPREAWEDAYRSLVLTPMALVEHAMGPMRAAGWGRILNVSSISVREPVANIVLSNAHRSGALSAF
jgi:3-oxoacyl-[acyl-carrier protein] reductase